MYGQSLDSALAMRYTDSGMGTAQETYACEESREPVYNKSANIQIRLTPQQKTRIEQAVLDETGDHRGTSRYIRDLIMKEVERIESRFKPEAIDPEFKG